MARANLSLPVKSISVPYPLPSIDQDEFDAVIEEIDEAYRRDAHAYVEHFRFDGQPRSFNEIMRDLRPTGNLARAFS